MSKKLIFKCPINSLSFGNVSYNFIRNLYYKNVDLALFPVNKNISLDAFEPVDPDIKKYILESIVNRYKKLERSTTTLNLWHLSGAELKISDKNLLYTFHETGECTQEELNISKTYDKCLFSSSFSKYYFEKSALKNAHNIPLRFDEDFHKIDKPYLGDTIHFGLMGKWEKRKHTSRIIKLWLDKFGDNKDYQLTCCVNNSFLNKEKIIELKNEALGGKQYSNINFLPWLQTNKEVNDYLNSIDIDLGGLSGGEGWNLPAFNATCLGKWSIVLNHSSHKDWANKDNSILIEPSGQEPIYDNTFFLEGQEFNQGYIKTFSDEQFNKSTDIAIEKVKSKTYNKEGSNLKLKFNYKNTIEQILSLI